MRKGKEGGEEERGKERREKGEGKPSIMRTWIKRTLPSALASPNAASNLAATFNYT